MQNKEPLITAQVKRQDSDKNYRVQTGTGTCRLPQDTGPEATSWEALYKLAVADVVGRVAGYSNHSVSKYMGSNGALYEI